MSHAAAVSKESGSAQALRSSLSIRAVLLLLMAWSIVPTTLGALGILYVTYQDERHQQVQSTIETARALTEVVDATIAKAEVAAAALAESPHLAAMNLAAFREQATETIKAAGVGSAVVLSDVAHRQILNTAAAPGAPLPFRGTTEPCARVFATAQPVISDIYTGAVQRRALMGANVPVMRGGKVAYCLTVSVLSSQFDQVLKNARLPAHWVLAVFDPHGVVAARTHSPEKFVGGKAVPEVVRALLSEREEGVVETRTLEGIPSMVAYSRSSATRWSIGVGMPVEMFEAPLRHHFQQLVGIVSLLALIGVAGAWLFAKRTTAAIRSLIGPAAALGRGEPFAAPSAHLRETDEVAEAMSSAAVLLKQRTDELIRAKDAAESGNRAKSTFLAVMSHEIRTPLHAITGMAHLIRRSGVEPHQLDLLNRIDAASEHLIDIINDVLDFSKIEADKMVLEQAPLSICGLLDNVSSMIEQSAEAKGLDVAVEPCAVSGHVIGDLRRLRQALLNYANNAVKFTSKGTIELKSFIVEESDADALIRFEVRDTGIGISEEDKARIFAPFEQIDGSMTRQYSGTGLGLVITRKIAELMGGTAGVESQVGVGSTFWFTARLAKTKESLRTVKRAPDASPEHMLKRDYPDLRVLVADDDPDNRFISQHLLKAVWPIIDTAEDGVQAVERVTENAYDLILMDMRMPRMDGLEATRRIRGLPNGRNTIILALTANVFAEDRVKCMEAGMDGLIPKAMGTAEPFATILEVLSKSH